MRVPKPMEFNQGRGAMFSSGHLVANPLRLHQTHFSTLSYFSTLSVYPKLVNLVLKRAKPLMTTETYYAREPPM